jgi:hypothetical protein
MNQALYWPANADLIVAKEADWVTFFEDQHLETIVDPMVYRTGQLFTEGAQSAGAQRDEIWQALSQNIGSLIAFFDALILNDQLPVIDYGFTFDTNAGFAVPKLMGLCNQAEKVLVGVHVMQDAYTTAHTAAIAELSQRALPDDLVQSIRQEMSAFDYGWAPRLWGSDMEVQLSEDELAVMRFAYGGLLFGAYAQLSGAQHLLQPKRSRLYLELSLPEKVVSSARDDEEQLFAALRETAPLSLGPDCEVIEFDALPSFLPYLLRDDPASPRQLLDNALRLRQRGDVIDYRAWRRRLIEDWRQKGRISADAERTVHELQEASNRLARANAEPTLPVKVSGTLVTIEPKALKVKLGDVGLETQVPLGQVRGWVLDQIPGRRYTKLLQRMQLAAHEYRNLDRHLENLWKGTLS